MRLPSNGNGELEGSMRLPSNGNGELEGSMRLPSNRNGELEGSMRLPSNGTSMRERDISSTRGKAPCEEVQRVRNEFETCLGAYLAHGKIPGPASAEFMLLRL